MLGTITKLEQQIVVAMERHYHHSVDKVWTYLTENDKLKQWFSELTIMELQAGGSITFDMGDGSYEKMRIIELDPKHVFAFTWDQDDVSFELHQTTSGCRLVFTEKLSAITEHTPRDLAGWHVCLDVISALLDGVESPARKETWTSLYEQYQKALSSSL